MNKQEAIEFLSLVLPFEDKGQDYCSDLDGKPLKDIGDLLRVLEEEYGELTLIGRHPELGDIYIVVDMDSDVYYKTVSPCEGNFKAMEAVYSLIP
jgi:hypothetical protein